MRASRLLVLPVVLLVSGCGDGGDDAVTSGGTTVTAGGSRTGPVGPDATDVEAVQRRVVTTEAGTVVVRVIDEVARLKVEAQDDSLYASPTVETPKALLSGLRGKPMGARCRLRDGRLTPTFPLRWREDSRDWGAALDVVGAWRQESRSFAEQVRSCTIRRGLPAGPGRTDVGSGPIVATATLAEP